MATGINPRFETYFAKRQTWHDEFIALREILLSSGLDEELKWRQPCYTHGGVNIVILSGFKKFCALGFFKGSLMPDPKNILKSPGPNSRAVKLVRFTSLAEVTARRATLKSYIRAAIKIAQSGEKVDFSANKKITLPDELHDYLKKNPDVKKAWDALTPGRQRSWVMHLESTRQSKTREARIAKAKAKIMQGLGMGEYAKP
jgi:uncharacterized protein YdeI (YjbR/CyaY-like superfamily)